jgi:putative hydrolase of the HAD superfamily
VLVSNTNDIHFQMIRRTYGVIRHFDAHVLSYQIGAMKPDEGMFEEAVRQANCRPEECFYTDDVMEFVEAGRSFGLDAVQFLGADQLAKELRKRGITPGEDPAIQPDSPAGRFEV